MSTPEQDRQAHARFERLQQLLLQDDRAVSSEIKAEVERLRAEMVSPEEIRTRISPFLDDKVRYMQDNFPELFGPVLTTAIKRQIAESQDEMVDALYPIIGKMIKKFVSKEIEALSQRLEFQINEAFSWQAWVRKMKGWFQSEETKRAQAARDMVRTQVEEVFIIDKASGLLAGSWSRHALADADMVAGMLTAIKSFVEHAFDQGAQELENIEYEDYKIVLNNFHTYYIAVVATGAVTPEFKFLLADMFMQFAEQQKLGTKDPTDETVQRNSKALESHLSAIIHEGQ